MADDDNYLNDDYKNFVPEGVENDEDFSKIQSIGTDGFVGAPTEPVCTVCYDPSPTTICLRCSLTTTCVICKETGVIEKCEGCNRCVCARWHCRPSCHLDRCADCIAEIAARIESDCSKNY